MTTNAKYNSRIWSDFDNKNLLKLNVNFSEIGQEVQHASSIVQTKNTHVMHEWRRDVKGRGGVSPGKTSIRSLIFSLTFQVADNRSIEDMNDFIQFMSIYDHPVSLDDGRDNYWHLVIVSPIFRGESLQNPGIEFKGLWDKAEVVTPTETIGEHIVTWTARFIATEYNYDLWTRYATMLETDNSSAIYIPRQNHGEFVYSKKGVVGDFPAGGNGTRLA